MALGALLHHDTPACYNPPMGIRYIGRDFRTRHGIGLRELARGTGMQNRTVIDLEYNRRPVSTETVERIVAYFRQRGVTCELGDLLVYEDPPHEEPDGQRDDSE